MTRPARMPIGLALARTAKAVSRAFNDALVEAGGSLPVWQILLALKAGRPENQRELAEAVDIRGATLSHHLDAMETGGLVTRRRDPANRRVQVVELTERGHASFERLRVAAVAHDRRLRAGLSEAEVDTLAKLLDRLHGNVAGRADHPGG